MLDLDRLRQVAEELYLPVVVRAHGQEGEFAMRKILELLHKIYQHITPEILTSPFIVFKTLDEHERPVDVNQARTVTDLSLLPQMVSGACALQILDNGQLLLWNNVTLDAQQLAQRAVVYKYDNRAEYFYAKDEKRLVIKVDPAYPSNFAIPTFSELGNALEHYRTRSVRESSCRILSMAWADDNRIFIKNAPEETMRNSLTQFLNDHLRGNMEVSPEQNMDDSHPVDIKITWWGTNNLAIIEIKWLGIPKYEDGHLGAGYYDARAREGAKQLAEYLDMSRRRAPVHITRGYLVVFDVRRARLSASTETISPEDGFHYRDKEIRFAPNYHEIRDDFEVPIRMFVEPICT